MASKKKENANVVNTDKVYDDIALALQHASTSTDESRNKVKQILHEHFGSFAELDHGNYVPAG